jgi:hypothetical protein
LKTTLSYVFICIQNDVFFFLNLDVSKDIAFFFFCFRAHMCSFCGPFMWPRGMCHCNFLIGEVRQGRAIPKRFDGVPMVQMSMMHPPPADMLDQSDPDDDAIPPPCAPVPFLPSGLVLTCTNMLRCGYHAFWWRSLGARATRSTA